MKKAFTLVEILVVLTVIALLLAVVITIFPGASNEARLKKSLKFSQTIHNSIGVDLVANYNGDEGGNGTCDSKDICDQSGYLNHGDNNGVIWDSDTPSGENYSLNFNNVGDYIEVTPTLGLDLTNKTIEVWVKTTQDNTGIIGQKDGTGKWALVIRNGHARFVDIVNGVYIEGNRVINDGQWHHVVAVAPASGLGNIIYVDSKLDTQKAIPNAPSSGTVFIGSCSRVASGLCANSYYSGRMDDVRIYNRAMNAVEIEQSYVEKAGSYGITLK
jgi:prepilin-type N-terminal cleavage/methylation domain-containing protein